MKGKTHDLNHDLTFSAHTINCVCHSIRSMFRVLGIYNFGFSFNRAASSLRRKNDFVFKQDCPIWAKVNIIWHVYLWIQFFVSKQPAQVILKKVCFVNFAKRIGKYKNYVSIFVKKNPCFISQFSNALLPHSILYC